MLNLIKKQAYANIELNGNIYIYIYIDHINEIDPKYITAYKSLQLGLQYLLFSNRTIQQQFQLLQLTMQNELKSKIELAQFIRNQVCLNNIYIYIHIGKQN